MSVADGIRTDQLRRLVATEQTKKESNMAQREGVGVGIKLVCPNGCDRTYTTLHATDEFGHRCPKAKRPAERLTWLVPAPDQEEVK